MSAPSSFLTPIPPSSNVLYLAHSADASESQSQVSALLPSDARLTLLAPDQLNTINTLPTSSFDYILSRPTLPDSPAFLQAQLNALRPGGSLLLLLPSSSSLSSSLQSELVLNGFVDVQSKEREGGVVEMVAQRPPWAANAAAPLKLKKKAAAPAPAPESKSVWNLAASDTNDLEADLADEDELLAADVVPDLPKPVASDCGTGSGPTRKACKGCSCGLADQLDAEASGQKVDAKPVSACGSCALGDAFRCASCPYLGQPAFSTTSSGAVKLQL